jgi:hypothetical protein
VIDGNIDRVDAMLKSIAIRIVPARRDNLHFRVASFQFERASVGGGVRRGLHAAFLKVHLSAVEYESGKRQEQGEQERHHDDGYTTLGALPLIVGIFQSAVQGSA